MPDSYEIRVMCRYCGEIYNSMVLQNHLEIEHKVCHSDSYMMSELMGGMSQRDGFIKGFQEKLKRYEH